MGTELKNSYMYIRNELDIDKTFDLTQKLWVIDDIDTDVRKKFRFDDVQQTSTDDLIGYDVDLTCLIDLSNYSYNTKKESYNPSNQNVKLQFSVMDPDPDFHKKVLENTRVIVKPEDILKSSIVRDGYKNNFFVRIQKLSFLKTDKDALTNQLRTMKETAEETIKSIDSNDKLDSQVKNRLKERLLKQLKNAEITMSSIIG